MTAIAYKDGVIATDGRIRQGDIIYSDNYIKAYKMENGVLFFSGELRVLDSVLDLQFLRTGADLRRDGNWSAFFYRDDGKLFLCSSDSDGLWMSEQRQTKTPDALGSGREFCLMAMDLGCSAKEAVEKTTKRDTSVGGTIREYVLSKLFSGVYVNDIQ